MYLLSSITDERLGVFQWGVVIGASLVAAICDLRTRRIPNALTFPVLVVGLIWAAWRGGLSGLADSAGACILVALPYIFLFIFAGGGAGDAKLMGAIGAWLGLRQGIIVLCSVAIAGIVLSIARAIAARHTKTVLTSVFVSMYTFLLSFTGCKTIRFTSNLTNREQPAYPEPACPESRTAGRACPSGRSDGLDIPYGIAIFVGVCAGGGIIWFL